MRKATPLRLKVMKAGNGSYRTKGGTWKYLTNNLVLTVPVDVITNGGTTQMAEGSAGQVLVTIYPNSKVTFDSITNANTVKVDPDGQFPKTTITVDEDLADRQRGILFLSAFRVLCRKSNLTLGGHGTIYTVSEYFEQSDFKGLDIWENDPAGSKSKVYVMSPNSTTPTSIVKAGEHRWADEWLAVH